MGAGVSGWQLARATSRLGCLGVVSSTALDVVVARRLQLGDPDGDLRRAFASFPWPEIPARVLAEYFVAGGKPAARPFKAVPIFSQRPSAPLVELTVLANFSEVLLAKEGHAGRVGINLLEKISLPTLPSLFGAMLAGVDYVIMGAGIPRAIPEILDDLAAGKPVTLKLAVENARQDFHATFDPADFFPVPLPPLKRPQFLAVVSSATLATTLVRKSKGRLDGFIVEGPSAGGHNAPPRGPLSLDATGAPVYGERDVVDLKKIRDLGLPFWMAGSFGRAGGLEEARQAGAAGIQVGTPFAFCEESGLDRDLKRRVLETICAEPLAVFTDPVASPTGFPFKVVQMPGTAGDPQAERPRRSICDLGYLRHFYEKADGDLGYRCPAEPPKNYARKGGDAADTAGRKCVCNGLLATIGLGQRREDGFVEPPLLTAGDSLPEIKRFLAGGARSYRAADVVDHLLGRKRA